MLNKVTFFENNQELIQFLLSRLEISFLVPEQCIIQQNNPAYKNIYFTGAGVASVYKDIDSRSRILVDQIDEGNIINLQSVINDVNPMFSVESKSYSTVATIHGHDFKEMLGMYPALKQKLTTSIIMNPFDLERDYFEHRIRKGIPYMSDLSQEVLR